MCHFWSGLFCFYLTGILGFWNSSGVSFADDSISLLNHFNQEGWGGFWNSYGMSSLYFLHDYIFITIHNLVGYHPKLWLLLVVLIHSSSAYLLFRILQLLSRDFEHSYHFSIISSLIFLLGAYQAEAVLWIAAIHYLISMLYMLVSIYIYLKHDFELPKYQKFLFWLAFILMSTMHEIVLFFPACLFLICLFQNFELKPIAQFKKQVDLILPYAIMCIGYLVLTFIFKGTWIPHYGKSHVTEFHIIEFLRTFINYFFKHFLFIHQFEYKTRDLFYTLGVPPVLLLSFLLIVFYLLFIIYFKSGKAKFGTLLFSLTLLYFLPVSTMYFFWHFPIQNDRLGYFLFCFGYPSLIYILFCIFKRFAVIISFVFLAFNFIFLRENVSKISEASQFIEKKLINSYTPYLRLKPIILNLPYNYKGMYGYRIPNRFREAIQYHHKISPEYTYTCSMPFMTEQDSITVDKLSESSFQINLITQGGWLMNKELGGFDYENNDVIVDYADDNMSAIIHIKKYSKNQPILYITTRSGFVKCKL